MQFNDQKFKKNPEFLVRKGFFKQVHHHNDFADPEVWDPDRLTAHLRRIVLVQGRCSKGSAKNTFNRDAVCLRQLQPYRIKQAGSRNKYVAPFPGTKSKSAGNRFLSRYLSPGPRFSFYPVIIQKSLELAVAVIGIEPGSNGFKQTIFVANLYIHHRIEFY